MTSNPDQTSPPTPAAPEIPGAGASAAPVDAVETLRLRILKEIDKIFDPEIPVSIYELGLIYGVDIQPGQPGYDVKIRMTLTAPGCPSAQELPVEVRARVSRIPEVREVEVEVVWDPPWSPALMTESAKLQLGMM